MAERNGTTLVGAIHDEDPKKKKMMTKKKRIKEEYNIGSAQDIHETVSEEKCFN